MQPLFNPDQLSRDGYPEDRRTVSDKFLIDPENYRRDGRERTRFGKWLRRSAPVLGRTVLQAGRGVLDGIPGVSQVVNTVLPVRPRTSIEASTRIMVGWSTVVLVGMAVLLKLTGHIDSFTLLKLVLAFMGL